MDEQRGSSRRRGLVIGGGLAGLAAAYELTRDPENRREVTVLQPGWRLGGKGASGRGRDDRIEEHGLHVWFGFYRNAFTLLGECYEALARGEVAATPQTLDEAFVACASLGLVAPDDGDAQRARPATTSTPSTGWSSTSSSAWAR